jgi:hypothetical protein
MALATTVVAVATMLFYWPAVIPSTYIVWEYANIAKPVVPSFHRNAELVITASMSVLILGLIGATFSRQLSSTSQKWAALFAAFLLSPFLYSALSTEWGLWWMEGVRQGVLAAQYAGLLGGIGLALMFNAGAAGPALISSLDQ